MGRTIASQFGNSSMLASGVAWSVLKWLLAATSAGTSSGTRRMSKSAPPARAPEAMAWAMASMCPWLLESATRTLVIGNPADGGGRWPGGSESPLSGEAWDRTAMDRSLQESEATMQCSKLRVEWPAVPIIKQ